MRPAIVVMALSVAAGCGDPELEPGSLAAMHTEEYAYADTNPDHPLDEAARAQLHKALAVLHDAADDDDTQLSRDIAEQTLARITAGEVLVGNIEGARGIDRWHMCKDRKLPVCEGSFPGDEDWVGDEELAATMKSRIAGYQWGNRIYFASTTDMSVEYLAEVLVHEVVHVHNRSECSYYTDIEQHVLDGTKAYVEEYRSFFSECHYERDAGASLEACNSWAVWRVRGYGFDHDLSSALPDGSDDPLELGKLLLEPPEPPARQFGHLVPSADSWPTSFGACPQEIE